MSIDLNQILSSAGLVSVRDIYRDAKTGVATAYTDAQENIDAIGGAIVETKDDVVDVAGVSITYVYIFAFSALLLYGPNVFQVFSDISTRIRQGGINFGVRI